MAIDITIEGGNKMRNRYKLDILTSLVAVVFILSLFSGTVAAQMPREQYEKAKEQYEKTNEQYEKAKEQYWMHKEKYENTREKFEKSKELFEEASREFKDVKDDKSRNELKLRTGEYLERAIDHIIGYLETLKYRIELPENREIVPFNASNNIDAHIAQLEQLRAKVQQANTSQEFKDAHKELKYLWIKIRLEARYYFEIILNNRIDKFITKTGNVSTKVDAAIQNQKAQSKDTAKLEDHAEDYKNLVKEAIDNKKVTDDLLEIHTGFASDGTVTDNEVADESIHQIDDSQRETIKKLKSVSKQLIDFVRDFKKLSGERARETERPEFSDHDDKAIAGNMAVDATVTPD